MSDNKEDIEKAKFFFDFATKENGIIEKANERIIDKTKYLIGLASTLIPIIFGLGYFIVTQGSTTWIFVPVIISLAMLLLSIVIGIFLLRPSNFLFIKTNVIINKYKKKPLRYIINKSAVTLSDVVQNNSNVINSKENLLTTMLFLIVIGLSILAVSFGILGYGYLTTKPVQ